jgi:hypothetical protein
LKQKRPPTADTASVGPDDDDLDTVDIINTAADIYDPNKPKKKSKVTVAEAMTWPEHWSAQEVIERIKQEEKALIERMEEEERLEAERKAERMANIRATDEWDEGRWRRTRLWVISGVYGSGTEGVSERVLEIQTSQS